MASIVFIMDAYATLNLVTDTSLLLMESLVRRGHRVLWLEPHQLWLQHDQVMGEVQVVESVTPFRLHPPMTLALDQCDGVLVRIDPPVDSHYLHLTYLLDHLDTSVVQFNDVAALRALNEKLLPLRWPDLVPPTLMARDGGRLQAFLNTHGDIVVKPLGDCSGRGVVRLQKEQATLEGLTALTLDAHQQPRFVLAQAFIPAVTDGDKRVYLFDGEVVGAVNRVPQQGGFLANIHQGARCEATNLSPAELSAIERIAPYLRDNGLFLVGVDFIGGYITEINLTSPSAIRQINRVTGGTVHETLVDKMLSVILRPQAREPWWHCCGGRVA